jgi:molybdopterin converting factor small subunit
MVKVKLYGMAQQLAGKEELEVSVKEPTTLTDLLKEITRKGRGISHREVQTILVNGRSCIFMEGLKTSVKDGDLVEVLPLITGG